MFRMPTTLMEALNRIQSLLLLLLFPHSPRIPSPFLILESNQIIIIQRTQYHHLRLKGDKDLSTSLTFQTLPSSILSLKTLHHSIKIPLKQLQQNQRWRGHYPRKHPFLLYRLSKSLRLLPTQKGVPKRYHLPFKPE